MSRINVTFCPFCGKEVSTDCWVATCDECKIEFYVKAQKVKCPVCSFWTEPEDEWGLCYFSCTSCYNDICPHCFGKVVDGKCTQCDWQCCGQCD